MNKTMAVLDANNIVINIIVCDESEPETEIQKTYTEDNPAFIGGDYFNNKFFPPKPFPSWIRSEDSWVAPVECPGNSINYFWNEDDLSWVARE